MLAVNALRGGEWLELVGIVLLLLFSGVMAASEVALTRLSLVRALALEEEGR